MAIERKGLSWWQQLTEAVGTPLAWSPLSRYIAWPDARSLANALEADDAHLEAEVDGRSPVSYGAQLRQEPVVNLPSCKSAKTAEGPDAYRYLGQMAHALVAPPSARIARDVRQVLLDGVRFVDVVWEVAACIVAYLGAYNYSALHVRRNDLQYKNVFVSSDQTLHHVAPLLHDGEPIYLATDETRPQFFDALRSRHPRLYQWGDLFTARTGHLLSGVEVPRKLIGCIEQAVCAMGRVFIGTQHSTFSGYIARLRGFIGAPDHLIYYHNTPWSADPEANRRQQPRHRGRNYMDEDPEMWTTTEGRGGRPGM